MRRPCRDEARVAAVVPTGLHGPGCGEQRGRPSYYRASGRPARRDPAALLTVGALEGIFRPLEIGRHLGGRLSSPGVSELPSGLDRERRRRGLA